MTGHVHIIFRRGANHYRLMFVPGGPDRHLIEGEDALRNFLLTDLEIPPGLTEAAITELGKSGRYTIEHILVTDRIKYFWRLDTTKWRRSGMTDSSASTFEHAYRGWKIRTTDTAVGTTFSARVEIWKPEHDPRSHSGIVVPFLKQAASPADAQVAALAAAKEWIDAEMV